MSDRTVPHPLTASRAETAARVITAMAGPGARLRPDQESAVAALSEPGARVLVVQATGWGKSAVYWVATAIRRAEGAGPTLVVSPLLSLMRDQVAAAERAGLRAATVSSANVEAWSTVEAALTGGDLDLLLVSPERLANPGFGRRVLDALTGRLGLVVIDEAHAVSDWGHDFRPDYRRVADVLRRLDPGTPVLATTATANERVTEDVARQLGEATVVIRGRLARASLELSVLDGLTPLQRYAWVAENLPRLPGSGIVYALTVADAERLADAVRAVHGGSVPVAAYTGQLDAGERERLEHALRDDALKALVATSALGMGFDKPDLGFVIHVGAPPSPVAYYQQVGRAGRAIEHAHAVLLASDADAAVWDYFATATLPVPDQVRRLLDELHGQGAMSVPALEARSGVRRGRVELMLRQLAVEEVVERTEAGWRETGKPWTPDPEHTAAVLAVRRREADIMRAYISGRRCLMELLQESLDDPHAERCGRCSVCRGGLPEGWRAVPEVDTVRTVAVALRRQEHVLDPRKMWPGGSFGARGRIPAAELAAEGRALVHADAPEWRDLVAQVFDGDAPAPAELLDACVGLLSGWRRSWPARPEVVVDLAAGGHPVLTGSVADHLAAVGRLERASPTLSAPGPGPSSVRGAGAPRSLRELSSADEAAFWRDRVDVSDIAGRVAGRPVLLVVDRTGSLWPVTVTASALRRAGASVVLPLVLHRLP